MGHVACRHAPDCPAKAERRRSSTDGNGVAGGRGVLSHHARYPVPHAGAGADGPCFHSPCYARYAEPRGHHLGGHQLFGAHPSLQLRAVRSGLFRHGYAEPGRRWRRAADGVPAICCVRTVQDRQAQITHLGIFAVHDVRCRFRQPAWGCAANGMPGQHASDQRSIGRRP